MTRTQTPLSFAAVRHMLAAARGGAEILEPRDLLTHPELAHELDELGDLCATLTAGAAAAAERRLPP